MRRFAFVLLGVVLASCNGDDDEIPPDSLLNPDGTLIGHKTNTDDGPIAGDQDADGLSDDDENTLGTDPNNPDTDGDALLDGWEVHGVDGTQLQADFGTDPRRIDVLVEMDFMTRNTATHGLGPSSGTPESVVQAIIDVFAAAPVTNHDGSLGIHLVLDYHPTQPGTSADNRGGEITHADTINTTNFYLAKLANFDQLKRGRSFHYMIWADSWEGDGRSGQAMGIPDPDFVVTLGSWNAPEGSDIGAGGLDDEKIGTFLHELGHSLGLQHGGEDPHRYKPNHMSVMNYFWQTTGLKRNDGTTKFTYQWLEIPPLNEQHLDETQGIGLKASLQAYQTTWFDPAGDLQLGNAAEPLDWDHSGGPDGTDVAVNLNMSTDSGNSIYGGASAVPVPPEGQTELQKTPNEWSMLMYKSGILGSGLPPDELSDVSDGPPSQGFAPAETLDENLAKRFRKDLFN